MIGVGLIHEYISSRFAIVTKCEKVKGDWFNLRQSGKKINKLKRLKKYFVRLLAAIRLKIDAGFK